MEPTVLKQFSTLIVELMWFWDIWTNQIQWLATHWLVMSAWLEAIRSLADCIVITDAMHKVSVWMRSKE